MYVILICQDPKVRATSYQSLIFEVAYKAFSQREINFQFCRQFGDNPNFTVKMVTAQFWCKKHRRR